MSNMSKKLLKKYIKEDYENRTLENAYSFVFMDAIHYKVREDKQIVCKAAYVVVGWC